MIDKARSAALELLRVVREDDAYANLAMPQILHGYGLTGRDAAFATELGYGTLRWQGWYDKVLTAHVTRPLDKVEPVLLDILRLGAHQLLAMRVPDHAAVDSSCDLAREHGPASSGRARAGFVNGVLRSIARSDAGELEANLQAGRGADDPLWLAERWSHPAWIVRALRDSLEPHADELPQLLQADNEPARPVLVARSMPVAELLQLPEVEAGRWSPRAAVLTEGPPEALACVRDGRVGVQDEGSQLVCLALAGVPVEGPETAWLDACAGPGGKAALLNSLAMEHGAYVTAVEQHAHRSALVEAALPEGSRSVVITGDARQGPWGDQRFDRVLVDVPCTGLGALRRRPESRWRRTQADLASLGPVQRDLLRAGVEAARPGGVIAYVTCSPHLAETDFVVSDVLRGRDDVEQLDAHDYLPGIPSCGDGLAVQLWPHRHGTDAMYLALLRKKA